MLLMEFKDQPYWLFQNIDNSNMNDDIIYLLMWITLFMVPTFDYVLNHFFSLSIYRQNLMFYCVLMSNYLIILVLVHYAVNQSWNMIKQSLLKKKVNLQKHMVFSYFKIILPNMVMYMSTAQIGSVLITRHLQLNIRLNIRLNIDVFYMYI